MQERKQIDCGLLLIATNKYKQFVQPLLDGVKKYFLLNHNIKVFLFTDEFNFYVGDERVRIEQHPIGSYKFPEASMLRYAIFNKYIDRIVGMDFLYYSDIDMAIVSEVGDEILEDIVAVKHPGFFKGGGSWETRPESNCYVPEDKREFYFAGGFQGGASWEYIKAINTMASMIHYDLEAGVTPVWHDESAWNKFLSVNKPTKILNPDFCMVEQDNLRKQWGIDHFEPKIIALAKNHKEIRE